MWFEVDVDWGHIRSSQRWKNKFVCVYTEVLVEPVCSEAAPPEPPFILNNHQN